MKILTIVFSLMLIIPNMDAGYRKICYFTNWAQYREDAFKVSDIDVTLCTHVIYSFATLNQISQISNSDPNDIKMYKEFNDLRTANPDIILMLAIGGSKFNITKMTYMLSSNITKIEFIASLIRFSRQYGFDGLDLDFEYPGRYPSPPEDRGKYTQFIKDLRRAIDMEELTPRIQKKLILSIAVPGNISILTNGFDIYEISQHVNFITVMAYDYVNSSSKVTGHNSPLYGDSNVFNDTNNINAVMEYLKRAYISPDQINLGIASYGRGFFLTNPEDFGLGAAVKCASPGGPVTKEIGFMAYFEIKKKLTDPNTYAYRFCDIQSPFLVNSNLWIGYEDEESLDIKMAYIKENTLGGWSMWSIDFDDFKGLYGDPYPLLRKLNQLDDPKFKGSPLDCSNNTSLYIRTTDIPKTYRKVCYLTSWAKTRTDNFKFTVDDVDPLLCTHVVYSFATINDHDIAYSDYADIADYEKLNQLRVRNPDVTILLALGDRNKNLTKVATMLNDIASRSTFIRSSINFLRMYNFDGFELHIKNSGLDKQKFTSLVQEMSIAFSNENVNPIKRLKLTIAIPATKTAADQDFNLGQLVNYVEFITLMTYDYEAPNITFHSSPLYGPSNFASHMDNINEMVEYFHSKGVEYQLMNLGIPFYGKGFHLKDKNQFLLGAPTKALNHLMPYTLQFGIVSYYEVLMSYLNQSTIFRPCDIQVPFLVKEDLWVGYDDELSIENKMKYAVSKGIGGLSVWSIDYDDFKGVFGKVYPLLNKINQIDDPTFSNNLDVICVDKTLVYRYNHVTRSSPHRSTSTTVAAKNVNNSTRKDSPLVTARRRTSTLTPPIRGSAIVSRNHLDIFLKKSGSNVAGGLEIIVAVNLMVVYVARMC